MKDINRIAILILLIGLLYALYIYQERYENKKPEKNSKRRDENKDYDDTQTLGSLLDVESFKSTESSDSFFE